MKKRIFASFLMIILIFMSFSVIACSSDGKRVSYKEFMNREVYEEGYFKYLLYSGVNAKPAEGKEIKAAIVGLTDEGQKREVLEIPRTVGDNIPVKQIGFEKREYVFSGNDYYVIETPNLKKLYVGDNVETIYNGFITIMQEGAKWFYEQQDFVGIKVIYNGEKKPQLTCNYFPLYVNNEIYKQNEWAGTDSDGINPKIFHRESDNDFFLVNIEFMNNYEDGTAKGYYRFDSVDEGEKIPVPPAPEREGYTFGGWYTEAECVNEWNFDTAPQITEGEQLRLYAGWEKAA